MKVNKLKILSISVCCAVTALWSWSQCMEPQQLRNDEPVRYNRTELLPTGSIISFAGEIPPNGWLMCNGQQCSIMHLDTPMKNRDCRNFHFLNLQTR